jgi:hypothetical protein
MTAIASPRLSPIDTVLVRLARRSGREPVAGKAVNSWTADCPIGHAGHVESLDVRAAKDGRVALACMFGCEAHAIAATLGLRVADLFPHPDYVEENGAAPTPEPDGLPRAIRAIDAPDPEPITWCVEELLIAAELAVFAGDGGSYKSTGAFHIAAAVAGGYSAFSRFPTKAGPVLILSAEDGEGVIRNRLEALIAGHGWDRERVLSNVYILASHDAKLSDAEWQRHLLAEAQRIGIKFMVCDPLFDLVEGDENSNSDLRPVIKFCRRIAGATGAAVVIVHHATKVKEGQRAIDRVRGASALRDAARCVLFFESKPEGIGIEHLKMSRSEKLEPFMLTREIESSEESRAVWVSARFAYQTVDAAALDRAEGFILDQITAFPGALNSTDLRKRGAVEQIRREDMSTAQSRLKARGLIDFVEGPRKARFWVLVDDPEAHRAVSRDLAQPDRARWATSDPDLAHLAQTPQGKVERAGRDPVHLAHPFRGGKQGGGSAAPGQGGQASYDEPLELADVPEEFDL